MDEEEEDELGSFSSFSNGGGDDEDEGEEVSSNSMSSSSSGDFGEYAASSSDGPLFEMSSILSQLPFKRGLSKHFEGKSQSFTSLSNVKSLEDLVKPERPFRSKLLKSSKSYGWGLDRHRALSPNHCSRSITKKNSRPNSFSPLGNMRRSSFLMSSRPPIPQQRSAGNLTGHTLLFA